MSLDSLINAIKFFEGKSLTKDSDIVEMGDFLIISGTLCMFSAVSAEKYTFVCLQDGTYWGEPFECPGERISVGNIKKRLESKPKITLIPNERN